MFRTTLLKSLRASVSKPSIVKTIQSSSRSLFTITTITNNKNVTPLTSSMNFIRCYSAFPELTRDIAKERIIELLEGYDKVDQSKGEITEQNSFTSDLGLDSLDVVEVIMELEHEFNIQIPDNEADSLKTVGQTIDYILAQPDSC
ncbi:acyl carrier protein [Candida albicans SC5314]|uniref:Acyl carrier protein n=1 Tax=Candida albicans P78048 TaxID=1094989 RepID=A0AB34Q0Q7_CANAX|nr:acyl carrier protein [Candida albicans P78048]KGR23652.1 acyl carrier protein [Candida albicans P37037]KGT72051.1 acyl carrier protein [Candida albicans 12C]KHC68766.1 acyl carrier protein [Candida albicans P75010]KHC89767.1 acyl carrier protein [Candida albicans SC5314]